MTRMDLVTFLANDVADSVLKTTRLSKYTSSTSGSDYYWALKKGAAKVFLDGLSYDQAVSVVMSNMTVPHQRSHNQLALKALYSWKLANPGEPLDPPIGAFAGPKGELIIKLEPAFGLCIKGKKTAFVPWPLKDFRLNAKVAGMGIYLLEQGLKKGDYADWKFCMIDLVSGDVFNRTHKDTAKAVDFALRTQEELLISFKDAA